MNLLKRIAASLSPAVRAKKKAALENLNDTSRAQDETYHATRERMNRLLDDALKNRTEPDHAGR